MLMDASPESFLQCFDSVFEHVEFREIVAIFFHIARYHTTHRYCLVQNARELSVGGVAQWLGCPSLAGRLLLIHA